MYWYILQTSSRPLLLQSRFLAYNSPKTVWLPVPGSAQTRWDLERSSDPIASIGFLPTFKVRGTEGMGRERRGKEAQEMRKGKGRRKEREGRTGEGKGRKEKEDLMNVGWLRACCDQEM